MIKKNLNRPKMWPQVKNIDGAVGYENDKKVKGRGSKKF